MKRHHNTLYVTTQGTYLAVSGETVIARSDGSAPVQLPLHLLESVVCFGRVTCSPALMAKCSERGVAIVFLTNRGRFLARVYGPISGNVLLRRAQYRASDDAAASARLARSFVLGKVANARSVILRALRDHPGGSGEPDVRRAVVLLGDVLRRIEAETDLERVRGLEGEAAHGYFGVFDSLLVAQKETFLFRGRKRRPPPDKINALLSFLYTLLTHDAASAVEGVGLDSQVGFLHRDRPGRPGLALDLAEEFRAFLADRLALSLVNRRQIDGEGFTTTESGGVIMTDETRRTVLVAYQQRKAEVIRHPFLNENTTIGMLVHLQALLLSRRLRGDLDEYPPFLWR